MNKWYDQNLADFVKNQSDTCGFSSQLLVFCSVNYFWEHVTKSVQSHLLMVLLSDSGGGGGGGQELFTHYSLVQREGLHWVQTS